MPTVEEVSEVAEELGLGLSASDAEAYTQLLGPWIGTFRKFEALASPEPKARTPGRRGRRAQDSENPLNGWYWKTAIRGSPGGKLAGKKIALKDSIMLEGIPMMIGASLLRGYRAEMDASVVTRVLEEGGEIAGKATSEYLCVSGGSHTSATGPVLNPYDKTRSAGGSSSGCAALVASGAVDMAIGGDQGGSIRTPAAWCGIVGLKPTHGLVPYTGSAPLEPVMDHLGPMTRTVADNALLLEVIAGPDGIDTRQMALITSGHTPGNYRDALEKGAKGLKIGLLEDGMKVRGLEPDVADKLEAAARRFQKLGADVANISIPAHALAATYWAPLGTGQMLPVLLDGWTAGAPGPIPVGLIDHLKRQKDRREEMPETVKLFLILATLMRKHHGMRHYALAMNARHDLQTAYDRAFGSCDLLLMPTTPMKATPLPGPEAGIAERVGRALEMMANSMPFNISHHPAMAMPCGMSEGLPVSMMLVARHFDEATLYRAAQAFEQSGDWRDM